MEMSRQRIRTSRAGKLDREVPALRRHRPRALGLLGRAAAPALARGDAAQGRDPQPDRAHAPRIALYVLNHKRAHLRDLEERFRITITVNADDEVGGTAGFVIDRGEQVHVGRAGQGARWRSRPIAAPALIEEEEPVIEEASRTRPTEDRSRADDRRGRAPTSADARRPSAAGEAPRERRAARRRPRARQRRRRRGRGGAARPRGRTQSRANAAIASRPANAAAARAARQQPGDRPAGAAEAQRGRVPKACRQSAGDGRARERRSQRRRTRRRRRGRRGGRRNRRDREG